MHQTAILIWTRV